MTLDIPSLLIGIAAPALSVFLVCIAAYISVYFTRPKGETRMRSEKRPDGVRDFRGIEEPKDEKFDDMVYMDEDHGL